VGRDAKFMGLGEDHLSTLLRRLFVVGSAGLVLAGAAGCGGSSPDHLSGDSGFTATSGDGGGAPAPNAGADAGISCDRYEALTPLGRVAVIQSLLPRNGITSDHQSAVIWERTTLGLCQINGGMVVDYLDASKYVPDTGDPAAGPPQPE
jgi:hypothetical protein